MKTKLTHNCIPNTVSINNGGGSYPAKAKTRYATFSALELNEREIKRIKCRKDSISSIRTTEVAILKTPVSSDHRS